MHTTHHISALRKGNALAGRSALVVLPKPLASAMSPDVAKLGLDRRSISPEPRRGRRAVDQVEARA